MTEWIEKKISELGTVVGGATPSTKDEQNYIDGSIPWITPKDLAGFRGRYISRGERSITQKGLASCSAQMMPKHSVLFTSRAPIGYVAISANPVCTNQGFKSVVPNENTDYLFLYYLLKFYKDKIEALGSGTTFKEVSGTTMKNIVVRVPKEKEKQREIGLILSSIDDKIEANEKINHNLEQQAEALYKKTFPYSGGDELPDNWHIGTVRDIIDLHDSKRIPLSSRERDKMTIKIYPYYGATSVMDHVEAYIFDGCYLLLGEDGTVIDDYGHPILQYVWGKFWVNNHAHIISGKNGFMVESLYLFFKQLNVRSIVTGAVQPKISQANLCSVPVVIPPEEVIRAFNEQIVPFFTMIRTNTDENARLSSLRDSLLPRIMAGEIDVSDIDI